MLAALEVSSPLSAAFALSPERPEDAAALESVLDRAFGPGRFAKTSERVRERFARPRPDLSRVARGPHGPVGLCRLSDIAVGGGRAHFLGPLAVDPRDQRAGLGQALVVAAVEACRRAGEAEGIILVGSPVFFAPLGFEPLARGAVTAPGPVNPARLLGLAFSPAFAQRRGAVTAP